MMGKRQSGILLHITSLPGPHGIGEIGPEARTFLKTLSAMGQKIWQILPIHPTGLDGAPYSALSSFAGNEALICLRDLIAYGLLTTEEVRSLEQLPTDLVNYDLALPLRQTLLLRAAHRFDAIADARQKRAFEAFKVEAGAKWLDNYALFRVLDHVYRGRGWMYWPKALALREPHALEEARTFYAPEIRAFMVLQFLFEQQWQALRSDAQKAGITLIGDMPIYVAQHSADVWSGRTYFQLDADGVARRVAGCPPDVFSSEGQRWGNPVYDWAAMEADGFQWWINRLERQLALADVVRIDHFRAFAAYWSIPAKNPTAKRGRWVRAPGEALFKKLLSHFGSLPVIAEDLGLINAPVIKLRNKFKFPGMKILQYELDEGVLAGKRHPSRYPANSVAYVGTHDNATAVEYALKPGKRPKRLQALSHMADVHWHLMQVAAHSNSNLVVHQMQDVLGLDVSGRMNVPGTIEGNWRWRLQPALLTPKLQEKLLKLTQETNR